VPVPSDRRLSDKVAIVTGAASGIGRAVALRFAAEGAKVACFDVAEEGAAKTAAAIGEGGGTAVAFRCDVSNETEVADAVSAAATALGSPNLLCNVAGIGTFAYSEELDLAEWNRVLAVNLTGTFLMCRAVLPHLLEHGGAIINTGSTAGLAAQPYSAAYCASKGGVALLTRSLAWEYVKRGVRVNAVAPGGIETPIHASFVIPDGADPTLMAKITPPVGFGQPEDVAALFAYLASDEARYVTGSIMTIDGGITS
jgi:NAD(P)-dependent dehydrogenase (short-subunit alcohol dehydrogenase family)